MRHGVEEKRRLLEGIQVLDLADEKAAFCAKLLGDLGARVVKIERPGGDPSRWRGPFIGESPHPEKSLFFYYNNMGKRSVTLNLEHPQGREIFLGLVEKADIVVESFPVGYLKRLSLGFEKLLERNPKLILISVTGFGQEGPRSGYRSCDLVASAMGGSMYVSGSPSSPPLKPAGEQSYYATSLFGAVGALLALRRRRLTGKGEHVDISAQEAVIATLDHVMVRYFYDQIVPKRQGGLSWNKESSLLPCKDGHIFVTLFQQWETLVEWMDSEGKAEDLTEEKWLDEAYRRDHIDHALEVIGRWTITHTREELFHKAQLMRLPWAPVSRPAEVLGHPQLRARAFFVEVDHPEMGLTINAPRPPYRFSESFLGPYRRAPRLGEDNIEIYQGSWAFQRRNTESSLLRTSCEEHPMGQRILRGVRVLDFTWMVAGPYATRLLGDFGAEVIKVQSKKTAQGAEQNVSGHFNTWNRNKRSITLDMSFPEARQLALRLAGTSDVVVENFSPRVMSNWGLDYPKMKEVNSDLIMVSLSAMGQTGPWKDFVALGPTLQALSGLTCLTSFSQDLPLGLGYAYADAIAGLYAALAILVALEYRDRTGQGQYIDLSEYESLCSLLGPTFLDLLVNRRGVLPEGNTSDGVDAVPYGVYECRGADRWCVIAVFDEAEWNALCRAMGYPFWCKEDRFSTAANRRRHSEELDTLLSRWTREHTAEEVMDSLQEAGVFAGIVQNAEDLARDPHLRARGFFVSLKHPVLGETFSDNTPIKFKDSSTADWKAAPLLGQDNRYVFVELLGLTEEEFSSYMGKGIIG